MLDTWVQTRRQLLRLRTARFASFLLSALLAAAPQAANVANAQGTASDCPNGGTIRFGVEPYEDAAVLAPAYQPLADALGKALHWLGPSWWRRSRMRTAIPPPTTPASPPGPAPE